MSIKKTGILIATALISFLPIYAYAGDLTIVNHTKSDTTSIINRGFCSSKVLGEAGITRAGQTNVVSDSNIRKACLLNKKDCHAVVYMTANCSGNPAADVYYDVDAGMKRVVMIDEKNNPFIITGSGFTTILDEK